MTRSRLLLVAALAALSAAPALARPPAEILTELEAVEYPRYDRDRASEPDYRAEYQLELKQTLQKKAALILELYQEAPEHEKVGELMPQRWSLLQDWGDAEHVPVVLEETEAIAQQPLADEKLRADADYWHASITCHSAEYDVDRCMPAIERFMQAQPGDDRAARLFIRVAGATKAPDLQIKLYKRSLALFPDSEHNRYTHGKLRQAEAIGQPFELAFTDAVTGREVSLQRDLRGKVVVLDFWATWCGPCLGEMPHMKELYDEFSGRGVEFIGVSLDEAESEGGLDALLKYIKENDIPWPQYYQGAGWKGEFSTKWGVNSIPAIFVVDARGRLHSVNARGKLEEMISELLGERDSG